MLQLDNQTRFEAQLLPANDKDGSPVVVVVAKGTYDIEPGRLPKLAKKQFPIQMTDKYAGEPGNSSVVYESDLAIYKPGTDVLLIGNAYAPGNDPVEYIDVHLDAGPLSKVIRVFGDRKWVRRTFGGPKPSPARPYRVMPLVYERAFGGVDQTHKDQDKHGWEERNPVGTGYRVNRSAVDSHPLPNLESPDQFIASWKDKPTPQGFGFIGRHWIPRRHYAGTYDVNWERSRAPILPEDFDYRYFQSAPPELVAYPPLAGNERFRATNVGPTRNLEFALPGDEVLVVGYFTEGEQTAESLLDTVVLLPDKGKLVLVWRCRFVCPRSYTELEVVQILPKGNTLPREPK